MNRTTRAGAIVTGIGSAIATLAMVTSCGAGNPSTDDLKGVSPSYPNYAAVFMNVDGFPNIAMVCIQGVGFETNSRQYNSVTEVPEWNAFCEKQIGKQATQNGQP